VIGRSLPMLRTSLSRYARDSGRLAAGELERWLGAIDSALERRRFMFALPQFLVRGIKA
jgi:hypothetical protein